MYLFWVIPIAKVLPYVIMLFLLKFYIIGIITLDKKNGV